MEPRGLNDDGSIGSLKSTVMGAVADALAAPRAGTLPETVGRVTSCAEVSMVVKEVTISTVVALPSRSLRPTATLTATDAAAAKFAGGTKTAENVRGS